MIIDTLIIKMILIVDSWQGVGGSASEVMGGHLWCLQPNMDANKNETLLPKLSTILFHFIFFISSTI